MIVLVLAVFTVIFAVAGAEFVRSTCRRQLIAPVVPRGAGRYGELE